MDDEGKMAQKGENACPYSFLCPRVTKSSHNGKILNYAFCVDSFASTGFSAESGRKSISVGDRRKAQRV